MRILIIFAVAFLAFCIVNGEHLVVGNVGLRNTLAYEETVEYMAYPFMKRVKTFFYSDPQNRPIIGIQAIDLHHSKASVNITAGGVGFSYVHLRMKSERGSGLRYSIGIYVGQPFQH